MRPSISRRPLRYQISVSVWDGYVRSAPGTVTIKVTNVNDNPPSVTAGQTFDIDQGYKRTIGWLESSDPDDMNQLGFTTFQDWQIVSGNPGSVFRVTPSAGELQIARPLLIDWRKTSYSLVTTVSDGANTSAATPVTVVIPNAGRHVPARRHQARSTEGERATGIPAGRRARILLQAAVID